MKKVSTKNLSKKLAKYGALSAAIAGVSNASGQVVYTDVDPDFDGTNGDIFTIDFNGDAVDDVSIVQSNNGNYELVTVSPEGNNGVLAQSNGNYNYASNIASGGSISAGAGSFRSFGDMCAGVGYLGSMFCGGSGFIGVEFTAGGNTHYGWVGVGTDDSSNYTVTGYAFEATPEAAIQAGDQGDPTGIEEEIFTNFKYFVDADGQLNLKSNTAMTRIIVHDLIGNKVLNANLNANYEVVDLNQLSTGIYVAMVTINEQTKSFKIFK